MIQLFDTLSYPELRYIVFFSTKLNISISDKKLLKKFMKWFYI